MCMLTHRLQVLLDAERMKRLQAEAARRRLAVAVLVRDAIDAAYPPAAALRESAAGRILAAESMPVPADVAELCGELDELRSRRA